MAKARRTGSFEENLDRFSIFAEKDGTHHSRDSFGFILHGTKTMGVYVKQIRQGSLIEKDGRLRVGDQLILIDDLSLVGMTAEQVVRVLKVAVQMNSKTEVSVIHRASRGKGIGWRPKTPNISSSMSDSHLAIEVRSHNLHVHAPITSTRISHESLINFGVEEQRKLIDDKENNNFNTEAVLENIPAYDALELDDLEEEDKFYTPPSIRYPAIPNIPSIEEINSKPRSKRPKKNAVNISSRSSSSGSGSESMTSGSTQQTELRPNSKLERFSPKFQFRQSANNAFGEIIDAEEILDESVSLKSEDFLSDDSFHVTKATSWSARLSGSPRKQAENVKDFLNRSVRKKTKPNEELALVSFDQLNNVVDTNKNEEGHRTASGQSLESQSSNQLSWHCPVCLDGATTITSTKRRLMSPACGHVFCSQCINDVVKERKPCPTCRAPVLKRDLHPIFM